MYELQKLKKQESWERYIGGYEGEKGMKKCYH